MRNINIFHISQETNTLKPNLRAFLEQKINRLWQTRSWFTWVLWPFSWVYRLVLVIRQRLSTHPESLPVPVVVVGNLTVGGNGKTPCVIAITKYLQNQGLKPGVVSRGYGRKKTTEPILVDASTPSLFSGDEPKEIFIATGCPVAVHEKRRLACEALLAQHHIDVIISDDGLQHLQLPQDITIAVMDEDSPLGNGFLLPAGPLREPASRLKQIDMVLLRSRNMSLNSPQSFTIKPKEWINLKTGEALSTDQLHRGTAIASIAKPERFWSTLDTLGVKGQRVAFADHHSYLENDLAPFKNQCILMTRKDAVKCQNFAAKHMWYLEVEATLPQSILAGIFDKVKDKQKA